MQCVYDIHAIYITNEVIMILIIGGIKGGTGKTTLATNLTVMRSTTGKKVLLVDADEQMSTKDWVDQRMALSIDTPWSTVQLSGKTVCHELEKFKKIYDDIIIDTGGRDNSSQRSALVVADIFLIPLRPKSLDVWTVSKVNQLIIEAKTINKKLKCYAVINQADSSGSDNEDVHHALTENANFDCVPTFLGYRKAFSNAAATGKGVVELKPSDKKAKSEIKSLYDIIYS